VDVKIDKQKKVEVVKGQVMKEGVNDGEAMRYKAERD
jgi:hypothetical protein